MDLINQLNQKCIDLDNKVANLANLGRSLADAENKYKIALAQESLKLKESINAIKLQIKILQFQIEKEYSLTKNM